MSVLGGVVWLGGSIGASETGPQLNYAECNYELMACRKTSSRHDSCMLAQEKVHPKCAQQPPEGLMPQTSNGYHPPPGCHLVAENCREDPECRPRLESFEQSCAIDSVTKKCAGRTSTCRMALLGILGTVLRTSCACQGTEVHQTYDCLGWQRLLWLNPCVGRDATWPPPPPLTHPH